MKDLNESQPAAQPPAGQAANPAEAVAKAIWQQTIGKQHGITLPDEPVSAPASQPAQPETPRMERCAICHKMVPDWVDPEWAPGRICKGCDEKHDPEWNKQSGTEQPAQPAPETPLTFEAWWRKYQSRTHLDPMPEEIWIAGRASRDSEVAALRERAEKAERFKAYVHKRLDEMGVPVDPESPHKADGCRIGGRLDWVEAGRAGAQKTIAELVEIIEPSALATSPKPGAVGTPSAWRVRTAGQVWSSLHETIGGAELELSHRRKMHPHGSHEIVPLVDSSPAPAPQRDEGAEPYCKCEVLDPLASWITRDDESGKCTVCGLMRCPPATAKEGSGLAVELSEAVEKTPLRRDVDDDGDAWNGRLDGLHGIDLYEAGHRDALRDAAARIKAHPALRLPAPPPPSATGKEE